MEHVAHFLTQKLIENKIIEDQDEETYCIYHYGIQLVLSSGIITVCISLLGLCFGKLLLAIVFMIALANLRHYAGGYHANSYNKCFLLSCSSFLGALAIVKLQACYPLKYSLMVGSLLATLYLLKVGSLNSKQNPKTKEEVLRK